MIIKNAMNTFLEKYKGQYELIIKNIDFCYVINKKIEMYLKH
jgi:hypothetical protein